MNETVEISEKDLYLMKVSRVQDNMQYIKMEIEANLVPNELILQDVIEDLIDMKRGVKSWRMRKQN